MLLNHYNEESQARALVEMGDISSLGATLKETDFYTTRGSWDRWGGEDMEYEQVKPRPYQDREMARRNMQTYLYLYTNEGWIYSDRGGAFQPLTLEVCAK